MRCYSVLSKKDCLYTGYQFKLGKISDDAIRAQHYILLLLGEQGAQSTYDIMIAMQNAGYKINKSNKVSSKLWWLKNSGLVEKDEDGRWRLTQLGEKIYKTLKEIYLKKATSSEKIKKMLGTIGIFQTGLERLRTALKGFEKKKSEILQVLEEIFRLDSDEKEVISYLLEHMKYANILNDLKGGVYVYADILVEDLGFDPNHLKKVVDKLQSKRLIYIYNVKGRPSRIGLKPELLNILRSHLTESSSSRYTSIAQLRSELQHYSQGNKSLKPCKTPTPCWGTTV